MRSNSAQSEDTRPQSEGSVSGQDCFRAAGPEPWVLTGYRLGLPFVLLVLAEQAARFWGTPVAFSKAPVIAGLAAFWLATFAWPSVALRYDRLVVLVAVWLSFAEGVALLALSQTPAMGVALLREVAGWGPVICAYWALPVHRRIDRTIVLVATFYLALLAADLWVQTAVGMSIFVGTPLQAIGQAAILAIIVWAAGMVHEGIANERDAAMRRALRDPLTCLPNRQAFEQELCRNVGLAKRHHQAFALLVLDVDHFKRFNDRHGHLAGDRVLQAVAHSCRSTLRQTDVVCRWGGEEFAIILPHVTAFESCRVANNLRKRIEATVATHDEPVTVSCGIALHRTDESPEALFARADAALFRAKAEGRNRIACSHDCPHAETAEAT